MIFGSRFMLCQVDKIETDMRPNPTVRSYGKNLVLLFSALWVIYQKTKKKKIIITTPMDPGWRFEYHSYRICNYENCISHFK